MQYSGYPDDELDSAKVQHQIGRPLPQFRHTVKLFLQHRWMFSCWRVLPVGEFFPNNMRIATPEKVISEGLAECNYLESCLEADSGDTSC